MTETGQFEIKIPGVSGDTLKYAVDFCYQQEINIDEHNVHDFLIIASFLQIPRLEVSCIKSYKSILKPTNCFKIWSIADQYAVIDLMRYAEAFVFRRFEEIAETPDFLKLSGHQLGVILKSNDLNVSSEEDVFNALMRWVRHDANQRKLAFKSLFNNIRLQFIKDTVSPICVCLRQRMACL